MNAASAQPTEGSLSSPAMLRSRPMNGRELGQPVPLLKVLPAYLGTSSIDEAIRTDRGRRVLWLEILLTDQLDLTP
jgi:hypothetical protein